ncbi:MAG: protein kinase [Deltaproteobacteria bacterium]|nr:protein kinase [Deltaproteobacteria bacterium]MCB9786309.1 protein kinase [Deltaproteobacteria bacterium]
MRICPHCERQTDAASCPEDNTETVSLATWTPALGDACIGALLNDRYQIEERIGVGAMGRVYRATDTRVAREVAVKVLRAELASDAEAQARFRQEVSVLARLHHRHIVHLYDHGVTDDGALFLVMEMLSGRSLAALIREEAPLDPRRVVRLAQGVLEALVEAHAEGVVHRDLKPENLFLHTRRRSGDILKVLDFGIAKILGTTTVDGLPLTHKGVVLGTPHYLAPEQLRGQAVTPRTDLYAFGAIVYELLTARRPFDDVESGDVARAHVESPVPPPQVKGRRLEGPLVDLVMSCLAKDPAERPPSAEEALIALEGFEDRPLRALKRRETVPSFPVVSGDARSGAEAAPRPRTGRRVLVPTTPRERKPTRPAMPVADPVSVAEFQASEARAAASEARIAPPFESMQTGRSVSTQWSREPKPRRRRYVVGAIALAAGIGALMVLMPRGGQTPVLDHVETVTAAAEHAEAERAVAESAPALPVDEAAVAESAPQRAAAVAPSEATAAGAPSGQLPSRAAAEAVVAPAVAPATASHDGVEAGGAPEAAQALVAEPVTEAPAPLRAEVASEPAGATVFSDGRRIGQTPMWIEWPADAAPPALELVSEGVHTSVQLVAGDAGKRRTVTLQAPVKQTPESATSDQPAPKADKSDKKVERSDRKVDRKPERAAPKADKSDKKASEPTRAHRTSRGSDSAAKKAEPAPAKKAEPAKKPERTGAGTWGPVD